MPPGTLSHGCARQDPYQIRLAQAATGAIVGLVSGLMVVASRSLTLVPRTTEAGKLQSRNSLCPDHSFCREAQPTRQTEYGIPALRTCTDGSWSRTSSRLLGSRLA